MEMNWYQKETDEVMKLLDSSDGGLTEDTARERLRIHGMNKTGGKKKDPVWRLFLNQFRDFMIIILVIAAVVSGIAGDLTDTIIIMVIIVLNAAIGFVQEYRAGRAIEAIKKLGAPVARVTREGKSSTINAENLVPGDIVILEAGNLVPADIRLTETYSMAADESMLTGESTSVTKETTRLAESNISIGDRSNMAFKGTLISRGRGKGIVTDTGINTEIGKIAGMLQEPESQTPLQKRMSDFGKKISMLIIVICGVLFGAGIYRGEEPINMLLIAISLAVAAIPEALPALITISLAIGSKKLAKKNALIRRLSAVETLGSVSVICSDKTGTITQNKMRVTEIIPNPIAKKIHEHLSLLECAMAVNHDVQLEPGTNPAGDPTEVALVNYIKENHPANILQELKTMLPRVGELPFDPIRKCMTTIHKHGDAYIVLSKGAVESITGLLAPSEHTGEILAEAGQLAEKGIRVLAFGYRMISGMPKSLNAQDVEYGLTFAGLTGMIDPPREEIKQAISECRSAGIRPVMITGDHLDTAIAIARETGIMRENDLALGGQDLEEMSAGELNDNIDRISVYARVSPEQKLSIVKSLQSKNQFVAMTGDGVNDAPPLKTADIGVAMGISGADVSKEAADMILLDDNFATIVKAVREGRGIYDNIRKFVKYIMTCNSAEIWTISLAPLIGLPVPLLPIHILWINLVTDGLPGLALASEKAERDIMKRPPRRAGESLFSGGIGKHIIWVSLLMTLINLSTEAIALKYGVEHWQTMIFTILSLSQLAHVFAIRSERTFIYKKGVFTNLPLLLVIVLTVLLQIALVYLPAANSLFKTQPLTATELLICFGLAGLVFHAVEFEKWIKGKFSKS